MYAFPRGRAFFWRTLLVLGSEMIRKSISLVFFFSVFSVFAQLTDYENSVLNSLGEIGRTLQSSSGSTANINTQLQNLKSLIEDTQASIKNSVSGIKTDTSYLNSINSTLSLIPSYLSPLALDSTVSHGFSSVVSSINSISIPNYSDSLSSILNSIGSVNTSLDSISSDLSGLALDSTLSSGIQSILDEFSDFRTSNIADIMTYTANTASWLGDYIYPDVHNGAIHLSYIRDYLASISSRFDVSLSSVVSSIDALGTTLDDINSTATSLDVTLNNIASYLDSIYSLQETHLPSIDDGVGNLVETASDILSKLNEFTPSESSYDDSKWSDYRTKADSFFDSFSTIFDGSRMDPSYRAVILNPTNGIFGTLGIERIPYSLTVRDSYATHVTANLVYLRQILSSISFINANILDTSHKILDRMPEQKDTSSEQSDLENAVSSTADGRDSIVDSLDFSGLEYNPKNEGVDAYFDYSDIFESFESDMPGTITFALPEFSLYGHSFGGQTVNIATERIRPLVDAMRACFAVLYWTVVGAIVLFGFKIFLKFARHFASLVKVALQW